MACAVPRAEGLATRPQPFCTLTADASRPPIHTDHVVTIRGLISFLGGVAVLIVATEMGLSQGQATVAAVVGLSIVYRVLGHSRLRLRRPPDDPPITPPESLADREGAVGFEIPRWLVRPIGWLLSRRRTP